MHRPSDRFGVSPHTHTPEHTEIRDLCRPMVAPVNGNVKCSRSRHRTQLFYKTKCTFTCDRGYRMLGPALVHCNGTGSWNSAENTMCICRCLPGGVGTMYISTGPLPLQPKRARHWRNRRTAS